MEEPRNDDLVRRLVEASELHGDFVLSSGKRSTVYFDKFRFLTRPDLLDELAGEVARLLPPGTDHLAAPEGAATLLVAAVSLRTGLPLAVVRKEPKAYGTRAQVEGEVPQQVRPRQEPELVEVDGRAGAARQDEVPVQLGRRDQAPGQVVVHGRVA